MSERVLRNRKPVEAPAEVPAKKPKLTKSKKEVKVVEEATAEPPKPVEKEDAATVAEENEDASGGASEDAQLRFNIVHCTS